MGRPADDVRGEPPGPVDRRRIRRVTDEQLLAAAVEVFARRGYAEASMDDVAAAAGATKPTLYARFGTKEALYRTTIEREAAALVDMTAGIFDTAGAPSVHAAIEAQSDALCTWARAHPHQLRLLLSATGPGAEAVRVSTIGAIRRLQGKAILAYLGDDSPPSPAAIDLLTAMIMGAVLGAMEHLVATDTDPRVVTLALAGFAEGALRHLDPRTLGAPVDG